MAVAEEAGQLRVREGGGRGRRRQSLCAGAGLSGSRMEALRFGPGLEGRNGLALGRPGASVGALEFLGEGSCRKEAEGNEAEAAEKRGAPPLRHCVLPVPPPLPLQPLALPCLPALQPGRLSPAGPLGNSQWAVAHLGRGDVGSPLGTVSERSGLERALDSAGLAEGGLWLATASEASGPEDPWSERFSHPAEMLVLPRGSWAPAQQTSLYFQRGSFLPYPQERGQVG